MSDAGSGEPRTAQLVAHTVAHTHLGNEACRLDPAADYSWCVCSCMQAAVLWVALSGCGVCWRQVACWHTTVHTPPDTQWQTEAAVAPVAFPCLPSPCPHLECHWAVPWWPLGKLSTGDMSGAVVCIAMHMVAALPAPIEVSWSLRSSCKFYRVTASVAGSCALPPALF